MKKGILRLPLAAVLLLLAVSLPQPGFADAGVGVGARGGGYFPLGPNTHLGLGTVYEGYMDCSQGSYSSCEEFYPEISFTVSF